MKGFRDKATLPFPFPSNRFSGTPDGGAHPSSSNAVPTTNHLPSSTSSWSAFLASAFSIFDPPRYLPVKASRGARPTKSWTAAVKKVVVLGSMRRFQGRVLGSSRTGISSPTSDIWLLGICYRLSSPNNASVELAAFELDFSSRILLTYRKGFEAIDDSGYTSDVNWGCMLRSSQMLVAQALLFHTTGRSWRKLPDKPLDQQYVQILKLFGDSNTSPLSIHNLIRAGKSYDLAAGSWVGPYAVCRSWENLFRSLRAANPAEDLLPMTIYIVSGDEDGARGGAPVFCIEDVESHCLEFSKGYTEWTPILLLVPLVLGLEKINPRYSPLLRATFSFPQSVGILGGKPGKSTYIVGVQDDDVFYLDPHDIQPVACINADNLEADTSSYHCNVVRHFPLDSLDSSLAIGFYCRDRDDFHDFCSRSTKLADESNGAPLFTVVEAHIQTMGTAVQGDNSLSVLLGTDGEGNIDVDEDDWQIL